MKRKGTLSHCGGVRCDKKLAERSYSDIAKDVPPVDRGADSLSYPSSPPFHEDGLRELPPKDGAERAKE